MDYYREVASTFSNKTVFSREEFADFMRVRKPTLMENSVGWLLYDLCQKRIVERVARNAYRAYTGESTLKDYKTELSEESSGILEFLREQFPLLELIVWETRAYNEFANHQLTRNFIFVESEKLICESVFSAVREQSSHTILFRPDEKEIDMYSGDVTVSVISLTSEAPIDGHHASLEKLLVDLFANKLLGQIISRGDYAGIYEEAFSKYNLNSKQMLRYARRRNKSDEVRTLLESTLNMSSVKGISFD